MGCCGVVQDDLKDFVAEEVGEPIRPTVAKALLFGTRKGRRRSIVGTRGVTVGMVAVYEAILASSVAND